VPRVHPAVLGPVSYRLILRHRVPEPEELSPPVRAAEVAVATRLSRALPRRTRVGPLTEGSRPDPRRGEDRHGSIPDRRHVQVVAVGAHRDVLSPREATPHRAGAPFEARVRRCRFAEDSDLRPQDRRSGGRASPEKKPAQAVSPMASRSAHRAPRVRSQRGCASRCA
jgi:hypothetical protein